MLTDRIEDAGRATLGEAIGRTFFGWIVGITVAFVWYIVQEELWLGLPLSHEADLVRDVGKLGWLQVYSEGDVIFAGLRVDRANLIYTIVLCYVSSILSFLVLTSCVQFTRDLVSALSRSQAKQRHFEESAIKTTGCNAMLECESAGASVSSAWYLRTSLEVIFVILVLSWLAGGIGNSVGEAINRRLPSWQPLIGIDAQLSSFADEFASVFRLSKAVGVGCASVGLVVWILCCHGKSRRLRKTS